MTRWVVWVAPLDETDTAARLEFTSEDADVYAGEVGVSIRTSPEPMGGYANERIIPWRRVLDYEKIGAE